MDDNNKAGMLSKYQLQLSDLFDPQQMNPEEVYLAKELFLFNYDFEELALEENVLVIDENRKRIQKIVRDVYQDNTRIFTLDPRFFEELIAELLRHQGFEVELTRQTRDNGFDILALHSIDKHTPLKFLVECKRYAPTRSVGVEIIRSFKEVIETEGANRGMIVTTSYFSEPAKKKQKEIPYKLDLKEKDDVMDWVCNYYISRLKV